MAGVLMKKRVRKHVLLLSCRWKISPHGVPRGGRYYTMHKNAGGQGENYQHPMCTTEHRPAIRFRNGLQCNYDCLKAQDAQPKRHWGACVGLAQTTH